METMVVEAVQHEFMLPMRSISCRSPLFVAIKRLALGEFPFLRKKQNNVKKDTKYLFLLSFKAVRPALVVVLEIAFVGVRLKKVCQRSPGTRSARRWINDALAGSALDQVAPSCG